MPRHRLPQAKAEVSGAALKNPATFKDRRAPSGLGPIGEPYPQMTLEQQAAWHDLARDLPWLNASHRTLLRLACIISARLDDEAVGINQLQTLSAILSKLGATPVDETRVNSVAEEVEDPADRFFTAPALGIRQ
jgi:hypothetical protein